LILAILALFQNYILAQVVTKSYNFPKLRVFQYEYNDQPVRELIFDESNTTNEFSKLPALYDKVEVNQLYTSYKYTLSNTQYEPLTSEEIALIPKEYNFTEPRVEIQTASDAHKHYAILNITPFVKIIFLIFISNVGN
jgi:hypothetical protein